MSPQKMPHEYGVRCAYYEGAIRHEGHIEHLRRKNPKHYPDLTFDWDNLFLACGSRSHCGHYKDHNQAYNPDPLIKPDEHDPEDFLYFHSSGEVCVREGLNGADKLRAETTIRVFGLKNPALTSQRARAVRQYQKLLAEDFEDLASWSEADRREYFENEIKETRWQPYATTIKHFFKSALRPHPALRI